MTRAQSRPEARSRGISSLRQSPVRFKLRRLIIARSVSYTHLASGGVDIIQPDLSHAGGITEVKKIAAMAEAFDVSVALHCPLGPIALAACLQVDFSTPNAFIQEQSAGIHYNEGYDLLNYLKNPEVFRYLSLIHI